MTASLQRMTRSWVIPAALAVTWLPYIATHCVGDRVTQEGCRALPRAAHVHSAARHSHEDSQGGQALTHREGQGEYSRIRTCCELTGSCNNVSAAVFSLDPRTSLVILPAVTRILMPAASETYETVFLALAHGPPIYLRNATLRL